MLFSGAFSGTNISALAPLARVARTSRPWPSRVESHQRRVFAIRGCGGLGLQKYEFRIPNIENCIDSRLCLAAASPTLSAPC